MFKGNVRALVALLLASLWAGSAWAAGGPVQAKTKARVTVARGSVQIAADAKGAEVWVDYADESAGAPVKVKSLSAGASHALLALSASERTFPFAAARNKELGVTATVAWAAKSSAAWLTVKTVSGKGNGKIVYDVAANTGKSSRTGKITVAGGGLTRTFTVTQLGKGVNATLTLGESIRTFTAVAAKNKEFGVSANVSWTAKSSVSWLTVKTASGQGNGKIVYDVEAAGSATRTGSITVSGGGLSRTFTVMQLGRGVVATLTLGARSRTFTSVASKSKELKISANVSWTAKSNVAWLTVKTAGGKGNGTIVYDVAANTGTASRTGILTVEGCGLTRTFTVTQMGKSKRTKAAGQVWVTTSDRSDGSAVADGDKGSGWSPAGAEGAWVALTFEKARDIGAVEIIGDKLPEGMRVLVSEDGDSWSDEGGESVSYLWLLLPGEGEAPTVREIVT